MITVITQTALCLLAGVVLWKMWRFLGARDKWVRWIVMVGFVGRAIAGTLLFWISWLSLPISSRPTGLYHMVFILPVKSLFGHPLLTPVPTWLEPWRTR